MRIESVRQGYDCEHSSVSYEFVSERRISDEIKDILKGSNESYHVTGNRVTMEVKGESYISDALQDMLLQKMPLLIYEDYDWWNFLLMFDYEESLLKSLQKFEYESDYSISVDKKGERIELWICVHVDYGALSDAGGRNPSALLRDIFLEVRESVLNGNFECIEMMHIYCKNRSEYNRYTPHSKLAAKLKPLLDTSVL